MTEEMTTDRFLIADVAMLTGVPAPRLRSWERAGLIQPRRSAGDVRVYGIEDVARARLIARSLVNPGRRGSLRRIASELASGTLRPNPDDYAGLRAGAISADNLSADHGWTLVDALPDLIAVWDEDGEFAFANQALRAVLRVDEKLDGHQPDGSIAEALLATGALAPRWTARTGVPQDEVALTLSLPNGDSRQTRWRTVPLRGLDGLPHGAMTIGRDLTESEANLRAREERLIAAASDLRPPAGIVLGNLQLARRTLANLLHDTEDTSDPQSSNGQAPGEASALSDRLQRHLSMAEAGTREMLRVLDTLLDASVAAGGGLLGQLTPETVDLPEVAAEAIVQARSLTSRHVFELAAPDSLAIVTGDRRRLRELFDNLLANAIAYAPEGGTIDVQFVLPDDAAVNLPQSPFGPYCLLRVTDAGIGIPEADLPHVFDRYYRGSNAATFVRGAGLGLFTVQAIATSHGGHAWIERTATADAATDTARPGTTVAIALPCRLPGHSQSNPTNGHERNREDLR